MANCSNKKTKLIIVTCKNEFYQNWLDYCKAKNITNQSQFIRDLLTEQINKSKYNRNSFIGE